MMRTLSSTVAALAVLFLALAPPAAIAQQPQQPQQQPQLAPPKAYKPVPVKLPQPVGEARSRALHPGWRVGRVGGQHEGHRPSRWRSGLLPCS